MKVAIIGGGIAGLSQGIFLKSKGFEVTIYERMRTMNSRGHAFLMNGEALNYLDKYINNTPKKLLKNKIDLFSLKSQNDEELIKIPLEGWFCIKRIDLINYLSSFFSENELKFGCEFSHFEFEEDKAKTVVFKNQIKADADVFIAADGSNSEIRKLLFGETKFTAVEVKEIVGISKFNKSDKYQTFQKFQSEDKGLSFGFIPAVNDESVWFMQYDIKLEKNFSMDNPEKIKEFCYSVLDGFPTEVKELLDSNDFSTSYLWNTRDFDLLDSFHKKNIVLIGDAAHQALPFTSAGTTNAIKDAAVLTEFLSQERDIEDAFSKYYDDRKDQIDEHLKLGRELKQNFLNYSEGKERKFLLPLISEKTEKKELKDSKPINIIYFTDPICSTCWIFQPILRKLKLEYQDHIDIDYRMGGLLPSWKDYNNEKISSPKDAAKLWDEMRVKYQVPINGDVWIEDPLLSSYPASIAFKAAQLQDNDKAISFLRRIKEMLFIEKKNVNKKENIESAALLSGLDSALLFKDIKNVGLNNFEQDLKLAEKHGVKVFPTLLFEKDGAIIKSLIGLQSYESIEKLFFEIEPGIRKNPQKLSSIELFKTFNNMTESELSFLMTLDEETTRNEIIKLEKKGIIQKYSTSDVNYWKIKLTT
jgi:2-polyprenyl-6-methoxyphenol hydroxylase-like FAD-dependent oxidoreductase/predicted DsbA family dithiol-disulfide isomerase